MFDFEKLEVYKKAKAFNKDVLTLMKNTKSIDVVTKNQLRRASLSIVLNIAEGTSRFSKPDKRNFYVISRGSAFECVAIFDVVFGHFRHRRIKLKTFPLYFYLVSIWKPGQSRLKIPLSDITEGTHDIRPYFYF